MVGSRSSPPEVRAVAIKTVMMMLESGIVNRVYYIAAEYLITERMGTVTTSMIEKITKRVGEQKVNMKPLTLSNIYNMIKLYSALMILNFICLIFEICYRKHADIEESKRTPWRLVKCNLWVNWWLHFLINLILRRYQHFNTLHLWSIFVNRVLKSIHDIANSIAIMREQTSVTYRNISGNVLTKLDMTVGMMNSPTHADMQNMLVIVLVTGKYCSMYPNTDA